ncbi:3D domain-containing protein [Cytobacillus purgationiresistens]|uniref:3D (Asp-Asp-Asp) domain-containing protein n=1 Tax=Cytobacillus purgationiresistens TaxID=863449 RepID=A0ABU0AL31_9BACI|nr:3D domain-containing protein [Cytobacillus purgationiresistens]MDQ0270755.1 3D (Asp-Asp-Asp) domain-containing protein [Cytobacillus purgationiresistens]
MTVISFFASILISQTIISHEIPSITSEEIAKRWAPNAQLWRQQVEVSAQANEELRSKNERLSAEIKRLNETAWQPFDASAYIADCAEGCSGITRVGIDVRNKTHHDGMRVIATDPSVVPLWSIVELRFADGRTERAISLDTGGAIRGRKLDYLIGSHGDAIQFGRQQVDVKIIERGAK